MKYMGNFIPHPHPLKPEWLGFGVSKEVQNSDLKLIPEKMYGKSYTVRFILLSWLIS